MKVNSVIRGFMWDHFRPFMINHIWKGRYGYKIDWNNPRDINEKMQWLACFGDTSLWSLCSDKYRVRDFLKQRGLENIAVRLLGVWSDPESIDYDSLPDKFVLKCNHDSGTCIIVDKTSHFNKEDINNELNKCLKVKFGYINGETYYNTIKPLVIAEDFLENKDCDFTSSLIDYKIWCFDGKPYCTWACYNRDRHGTYVNIYDMDWKVHPEYSVFTDHYRDGEGRVPKPKSFDQMMHVAAILSKDFPEVRVDLYEVDNKVYFGELTFMTLFGQIDFYTEDFLIELGNQCILPIRNR